MKGKVGVTANITSRFQDFHAYTSSETKTAIDKAVSDREKKLADLRDANPKPKFWKKFDTPKFGCGRNVRFGDLNGDGKTDMLFCQNIQKGLGANFVEIKGMLGHFPYPYHDQSGDDQGDNQEVARDKIMIGYSMWDHAGKQLWTRDEEFQDHADGVAYGNFSDDPKAPPFGYYSGSDEGFMFNKVHVQQRFWRVSYFTLLALFASLAVSLY